MSAGVSGRNAFPLRVDAALLVLRVCAGLSLFFKHGTEKLFHFSAMSAHFPNPIHIGSTPSLVLALIGDAICSILIVLGLATRWACLFAFVNIFVAWSLVHHFEFFGQSAGHGELMFLYLTAFLTILIAGPGRFSLDRLQSRR